MLPKTENTEGCPELKKGKKKSHFYTVNIDPSRPILADLYCKSVCWDKDTTTREKGVNEPGDFVFRRLPF